MIEQSKIYVNYWLIDRRSKLPLKNKILIWKIILISIWTYGIELCRCLNKDTIAIQLRGQSKILRSMINAPWSISNQTLHDDLGIPFIVNTIQKKKEYKASQQTRNALQPSRATTAATARLSKIKKLLVNRVQARKKRSFHWKKLECYDPNYSWLISLYQLKRLAFIYIYI